jgi:thiamine-phosphate pyrophosphorylase
MLGLYPIVDVDSIKALKLDPIEFARRVLAARPVALQLRAKHLSARETLALLRELRPLCSETATALFANDRPDLALLAGCDGVHVGQDDLSISNVRSVAPGLRVGASTHDLSQLRDALSRRPDYVAFGPVFTTTSKERPDPVVGLDGLTRAVDLAKRAGVPIIAIGGVTRSNAPAIAALGIGGAVIGALLPADGDLEAVGSLALRLGDALRGKA